MVAIRDGCVSIEDVQSRVRRRFRVVREALRDLERSKRIEHTEKDGVHSWCEMVRS
jgi:peptide deformylase